MSTDAAGDLAAEIGGGHGVVPSERVDAVGLVADPRRHHLAARVALGHRRA